MKRLTKFGHVWRHKKTGKICGSSIDVKNLEELKEYEQILKRKAVEAKSQELPKENEGEILSAPNKTRRTE